MDNITANITVGRLPASITVDSVTVGSITAYITVGRLPGSNTIDSITIDGTEKR